MRRRGGSSSSHTAAAIGWGAWCHTPASIRSPFPTQTERQQSRAELGAPSLSTRSNFFTDPNMCRGLDSLPITCLERWAHRKLQAFSFGFCLFFQTWTSNSWMFKGWISKSFSLFLQGEGAAGAVWKLPAEIRPQLQEKRQTKVNIQIYHFKLFENTSGCNVYYFIYV